MRKTVFCVLLCAGAANASAPSKISSELLVRAVAWDASWKPATEAEWNARVVAEVASAAKDGADVVVFPEGFSGGRGLEGVLSGVRDAAGADRLVVLGNAPHREPGWDHSVSRARILSGGSWQEMDKLDPTPAERDGTPPVRPGIRLPLFRFRGAVVAALTASAIQKPEIAASLKKRAVQLVLVSAPALDEAGAARVERCASARAVELGAAVVVARPSPEAPSLHLPAQKGFEAKPAPLAGRDARIPWKRLLDLRASPDSAAEAPFLDPAPAYQIEI